MKVRLTHRARRYLEKAIHRSGKSQLVPALLLAHESTGPTSYFWGLFTDRRITHRHGWFCYLYRPEQRPAEWMVDVGGLHLSVSPDMQKQLDGKTLDVRRGQLEEEKNEPI